MRIKRSSPLSHLLPCPIFHVIPDWAKVVGNIRFNDNPFPDEISCMVYLAGYRNVPTSRQPPAFIYISRNEILLRGPIIGRGGSELVEDPGKRYAGRPNERHNDMRTFCPGGLEVGDRCKAQPSPHESLGFKIGDQLGSYPDSVPICNHRRA